MICKDESKLWTLPQICRETSEAIRRLSEKQKAELRVHLRQVYNIPAKPEPDLWKN
jgi:hypothetical protein